MRRTKIVCTMGPALDDENLLKEIILEGMDVARFNFSHGDYESHKRRLDMLKKVREELDMPIAALLDTKGPEIRIGKFAAGKVRLLKDQLFTLTTDDIAGDETRVSVTYKDLPADIRVGGTILIDDGLIEMTVADINGTDCICRVQNEGEISDNKGVNVPGTQLSMPFISRKDRDDIIFGIENGFDFIAASFTRTAEDILEIRKILEEKNCHNISIIAKIENLQGVDNIDEIIRVSDGIMIARGDMGVEIPLEEVPVLQKMIIKKVYNAGKQVITATQMLDSMMKNPRPTRAEATDVANAIYDGTSAIMLSGETAAGKYPLQAVKTMAKIAKRTEEDIDYIKRFKMRDVELNNDVTNAISHATCTTAHDLGAAAIVTVTKSGKTARMISKYRPNCLIIGCSPSPNVCRQLNMSWGIIPLLVDEKKTADELFDHAVDKAEKSGIITAGEIVVITAGVPLGISGTTNMMKVQVAGHILLSGQGVTQASVCAKLCVCRNEKEAFANFKEGDVIVIHSTSNELLPLLRRSSGIITEVGGSNSHASIVGLSLNLPVIINAENATRILKSGVSVMVDAVRGIVSACY
ncbi:MAG: pyruvate kinase [Saccharofermentanales bacterium]